MDPSAFEEVYESRSRPLLVFFVRRTFDVEVARDLVAETFAQAFEARGRYRGSTDAEAAGWLYAIARHQLSHYARRGAVRKKAVRRLGISLPVVSEEDYERIVELAGLAELRGRVAAAFGDLGPDERAALRLRVIEEQPYPEVAAGLGVSEQTARARVSRALRRLSDAIEMTTFLGGPAMSEIRMLDDLGAEFARVAESSPPRRARRASGHAVAVAIAVIVLLGAGVYAVPATRAAIDDITSSLAGWVEGDEEAAPGRALGPEDDAPDWIRTDDTRLIAKVRDLPLYVSRIEDHNGVDGLRLQCRQRVRDRGQRGWLALPVRRPRRADPRPEPRRARTELRRIRPVGGHRRLGRRMALTYASGEPTRAEGLDGGFAVIADAHRRLDEVIVYDEAGRELERTDVSDIIALGSKCIELNRKRAEGG